MVTELGRGWGRRARRERMLTQPGPCCSLGEGWGWRGARVVTVVLWPRKPHGEGWISVRPRVNQGLCDWLSSRQFRVGSAGQGEAVPSRAGGAAQCLPSCASANPWGALVLGVPVGSVAACPGLAAGLEIPRGCVRDSVDGEICWGCRLSTTFSSLRHRAGQSRTAENSWAWQWEITPW